MSFPFDSTGAAIVADFFAETKSFDPSKVNLLLYQQLADGEELILQVVDQMTLRLLVHADMLAGMIDKAGSKEATNDPGLIVQFRAKRSLCLAAVSLIITFQLVDQVSKYNPVNPFELRAIGDQLWVVGMPK